MTRVEAFKEARERWENGPVVGVNRQEVDAPFHVGQKTSGNAWLKYGAGKTWEEAFTNVKDVVRQLPDGRPVFKKEEEKP